MEEFPSNSYHNPKVTQKTAKPTAKTKLAPVVTGDVVVAPTSPVKKFGRAFFGGHIRDVIRFVASDVLLPSAKNLFVDMANKGVDRMVYGDRPSPRQTTNRLTPRMSYNSVARQTASVMLPDQPPLNQRLNGRRMDVGEIVLSSRGEAEAVLDGLMSVIETHDAASLADLYDLLRLPSAYTDNNWGWTNLATASITQVRQGFLLSLPQAIAL